MLVWIANAQRVVHHLRFTFELCDYIYNLKKNVLLTDTRHILIGFSVVEN